MNVPTKARVELMSGIFVLSEGVARYVVKGITYTLALNDPSTCTSAIFVVPKNCNVGLPRILSSANASGFSRRSNFDFPLGVDVTAGFPELDDTESRARVKLRPSRAMYESGSSSAPRYSRRWFATVDVDAFDASRSIVGIHGRVNTEARDAGISCVCCPGRLKDGVDCCDCKRAGSRRATRCCLRP